MEILVRITRVNNGKPFVDNKCKKGKVTLIYADNDYRQEKIRKLEEMITNNGITEEQIIAAGKEE